jgi:hypothetical protein
MAEERPLIDPQWLIQARRRRFMFVGRLAVVFVLLTLLAWWILPTIRDKVGDLGKAPAVRVGKGKAQQPQLSTFASILLGGVGVFKVFWVGIAIGCGAAALLALTGKIDSLVPILNWVLLAVGLATVALTFYVFYLPMTTLLGQAGVGP